MTMPPPSFRCPRCGAVSYNPHDLAARYCGRCHVFVTLDELRAAEQQPDLWLVQYLCPSRHAIAASPYDRHVTEPAAHEGAMLAHLAAAGVQPWCALCGSRDLRFEHRRLPFRDWPTAMEALHRVEAENLRSRQAINQARGEN